MLKFILNGKELQVEEGSTILQAALKEGIKIPTLCYHKELTPYGSCRLCLVEIVSGGRVGLQAACLYKVSEGLVVKTDTERVKKARQIVFELLLAKNPDAEKIKTLAQEYGVTQSRIKLKNRSDCILCGLCMRVCAEVVGMNSIAFAHRGSERKIKTPFDRVSDTCIGCGACAYICPTKVIKIEGAE